MDLSGSDLCCIQPQSPIIRLDEQIFSERSTSCCAAELLRVSEIKARLTLEAFCTHWIVNLTVGKCGRAVDAHILDAQIHWGQLRECWLLKAVITLQTRAKSRAQLAVFVDWAAILGRHYTGVFILDVEFAPISLTPVCVDEGIRFAASSDDS
jgi:hypothetical protein